MSIIKIRRSGSSGSPSELAQGELAYSYLGGTQSNGGDRLYIGTGTEIAGVAANIEVVGGKYFTEKLDHVPGVLAANSALIVDADGKIDILNVDNITINGNEISSTNTDGNITLNPTGSGAIDASSAQIINLANPTSAQHAVTLSYLEASFSANLSIAGDSGTDVITLLNETLTFSGDTGITTTVSSNTVTIDLDDTTVTPGSYGNTTSIATFTVDQQGRLTAAGTASLATTLSIDADAGTPDTIDLLNDTLIFAGNTGITTTVSDNQIDIDLDDTAVTAGTYGTAIATTTFTVDAQGRLTAAAANTIAIPSSQITDFEESVEDVVGGMLTGTQNGITVTYTDGGVGAGVLNFDVADPTITIAGDVAGSATMTNLGNVTITVAQQADSVDLGTHTTGNYVASLVAGTGVTLTNNTGETATPTIAIGQAVETSSNVTFVDGQFTGDVIIDGDLTVSGTQVILNATNLSIEDNLIYLNSGSTVTNPDLGWSGSYNDGTAKNAGFYRDATDGYFKPFKDYTPDSSELLAIDTSHASFALADIQAANFRGALIGNADTATVWATARTITLAGDLGGNVSINGSADVTLTATIQANSVALGTDTTGNYAADVAVSGSGLSITGSAGEGTQYTIASNGTNASTPSTLVFRDSDRSFSANVVSAALVGNASTATALETARTIALAGDVAGSVSFDGTGNVSITTTIQADSVALGTDTTGNYVASVGVTSGTGLSITGTGEGAAVTLAGVDATTSVKGVASFDSGNFTVSSGAVSISAIDGGTY